MQEEGFPMFFGASLAKRTRGRHFSIVLLVLAFLSVAPVGYMEDESMTSEKSSYSTGIFQDSKLFLSTPLQSVRSASKDLSRSPSPECRFEEGFSLQKSLPKMASFAVLRC